MSNDRYPKINDYEHLDKLPLTSENKNKHLIYYGIAALAILSLGKYFYDNTKDNSYPRNNKRNRPKSNLKKVDSRDRINDDTDSFVQDRYKKTKRSKEQSREGVLPKIDTDTDTEGITKALKDLKKMKSSFQPIDEDSKTQYKKIVTNILVAEYFIKLNKGNDSETSLKELGEAYLKEFNPEVKKRSGLEHLYDEMLLDVGKVALIGYISEGRRERFKLVKAGLEKGSDILDFSDHIKVIVDKESSKVLDSIDNILSPKPQRKNSSKTYFTLEELIYMYSDMIPSGTQGNIKDFQRKIYSLEFENAYNKFFRVKDLDQSSHHRTSRDYTPSLTPEPSIRTRRNGSSRDERGMVHK